jgi:hypothetical protein
MTALQVQNLPPHVFAFIGVLGCLFAVFLLLFVWRGLVLRYRLGSLTTQIWRRVHQKQEVDSLFKKDRIFRHQWREFRKTLHEQKEFSPDTGELKTVALRPTVPAEFFFNGQALVDNRLYTEFFKHLPGIFTGIGIIGTFSGLILGLQAFQVSEAPSVVRQSLNSLLHGVWEAFLVSAIAITLAMVVTLLEKLLLASLYRGVEKLNQAIDSQLQAGAGEEYLSRLVQASEESAAQTKILKDALVSDLKQVLTELTERQIAAMQTGYVKVGEALGNKIAETMEPALAAMKESHRQLGQDQSSTVATLLTDVMAGFSQQLRDVFGDQVSGINRLQQQTISALQSAVAQLEHMAADIRDSGAQTNAAMSERLASALDAMETRQATQNSHMAEFLAQMRDLNRASQEESGAKLQATLADIGAKVSDIIRGLQEQAAHAARVNEEREIGVARRADEAAARTNSQVEEILKAMASASGQMASSVAALREVTTSAIDKMNTGAESLFVAASDFAKAGQGVSGAMDKASIVSAALTQAAGSVSASTRSLDTTLQDYRTARDSVTTMVAELRSIVEHAKKEASITADVLERIDGAASRLTGAQQQADKYLEGVSEVLINGHETFRTELKKTISQSTALFYEQLSDATKALSTGIEEFEVVLTELSSRRPH